MRPKLHQNYITCFRKFDIICECSTFKYLKTNWQKNVCELISTIQQVQVIGAWVNLNNAFYYMMYCLGNSN